MMASRPGKMPTTSVRLRTSLFRRSWGLLLDTCRQISCGKAVKARMSSRASSRWAAGGLRELRLERGDDLAVRVHPGADHLRAARRRLCPRSPRLSGLGDAGEQVTMVMQS
jgi:hypothetical protein